MVPGVARLTRRVVERASTVIAVSDYLRRELALKLPEARGKTEVVDSGVDLTRFGLTVEARHGAERHAFVAVGEPDRAQERRGPGRRVRDPRSGEPRLRRRRPAARSARRPRARVTVTGRVPHDAVPAYLAAADVLCAPALLEPFGQAILEGMAAGKTVVATRIGGPPEFVTPDAGLLVDPLDGRALALALESAAAFPSPNEAAREAAADHDVRLQAERVEAILLRASQDRRA